MNKFLHIGVEDTLNSIHVYGDHFVTVQHRLNGARGNWYAMSVSRDVEIVTDEPNEKVGRVGNNTFRLVVWHTGHDEDGDIHTAHLEVQTERGERVTLWQDHFFYGVVPYSRIWIE